MPPKKTYSVKRTYTHSGKTVVVNVKNITKDAQKFIKNKTECYPKMKNSKEYTQKKSWIKLKKLIAKCRKISKRRDFDSDDESKSKEEKWGKKDHRELVKCLVLHSGSKKKLDVVTISSYDIVYAIIKAIIKILEPKINAITNIREQNPATAAKLVYEAILSLPLKIQHNGVDWEDGEKWSTFKFESKPAEPRFEGRSEGYQIYWEYELPSGYPIFALEYCMGFTGPLNALFQRCGWENEVHFINGDEFNHKEYDDFSMIAIDPILGW